jgi:hypothetical protein
VLGAHMEKVTGRRFGRVRATSRAGYGRGVCERWLPPSLSSWSDAFSRAMCTAWRSSRAEPRAQRRTSMVAGSFASRLATHRRLGRSDGNVSGGARTAFVQRNVAMPTPPVASSNSGGARAAPIRMRRHRRAVAAAPARESLHRDARLEPRERRADAEMREPAQRDVLVLTTAAATRPVPPPQAPRASPMQSWGGRRRRRRRCRTRSRSRQ